ncbi:serine hydrolase domain-containing protein [Parasphingorhabdus cellanae]|uniref:Serine hydrolase n=1 Tax=Parasphingorhabdus cellanae TaxID=2806553 RepID=A0ABX7T939_9SPHN|nr:serine hydrolase [Parasphingorhabdus cellanae]QTD57029.1 serine hydrolase [Parasphingorhabdus cellanae]
MIEFDADDKATIAIQGLSNRNTGRALMPDDPVRIASISKLFVSLAAMRLVEQGILDLDTDVSDYLGWSLRHPDHPAVPITLRLLLSHQSGLRDGINYALPMDARLETELRSQQAWDTHHAPGTYFAYANLNFPIVAAVMEAATGDRFDRIMKTQVFDPLDLDACFNWTLCSDQKVAAAVTLYRANGDVVRDDLRGRREDCSVVPASDGSCDLKAYQLGKTGSIFSPQGGLRISARDLAKIGQMFLRNDGTFLSNSSIATMTSPIWLYDGTNGDSEDGYFCAYGLAVHILAAPDRPQSCKDDPFGDNQMRFGHSGEAYALKSGLWVNPVTNQGTAFYRTQVPENDPSGHCIYFCE